MYLQEVSGSLELQKCIFLSKGYNSENATLPGSGTMKRRLHSFGLVMCGGM
jgi:hypothetical protein